MSSGAAVAAAAEAKPGAVIITDKINADIKI
jgi:hypothetical protein